MKKINIKRKKTLASAGIEKVIVYKIACRLSALPANLNILVTLKTLMTLAIFGPTLRKPPASKFMNSKATSKREALTTKKSNLFQELLK
jgi:hypothetical protein